MKTLRPRCCTNRTSAIFWMASAGVLYGLVLLLLQWRPGLEGYHTALALAALGVACLLNATRHGTYHCALTGPLLLALAAAVALDEAGFLDVPAPIVWAVALCGTATAFLLEFRFGSRGEGSRPADRDATS